MAYIRLDTEQNIFRAPHSSFHRDRSDVQGKQHVPALLRQVPYEAIRKTACDLAQIKDSSKAISHGEPVPMKAEAVRTDGVPPVFAPPSQSGQIHRQPVFLFPAVEAPQTFKPLHGVQRLQFRAQGGKARRQLPFGAGKIVSCRFRRFGRMRQSQIFFLLQRTILSSRLLQQIVEFRPQRIQTIPARFQKCLPRTAPVVRLPILQCDFSL